MYIALSIEVWLNRIKEVVSTVINSEEEYLHIHQSLALGKHVVATVADVYGNIVVFFRLL